MNNQQSPETTGTRPDHACELCGRFDAVQVADRFLCIDCYEGCGACCQGSTMED
ncbi:MAG TPA: hypothetical protein VK327_03620 [Candidatus Paceibacterota bacterium]|nr:hypothetical protein [Candidatus Paceibacterota bacterium]